jgi:hypothetical protein
MPQNAGRNRPYLWCESVGRLGCVQSTTTVSSSGGSSAQGRKLKLSGSGLLYKLYSNLRYISSTSAVVHQQYISSTKAVRQQYGASERAWAVGCREVVDALGL